MQILPSHLMGLLPLLSNLSLMFTRIGLRLIELMEKWQFLENICVKEFAVCMIFMGPIPIVLVLGRFILKTWCILYVQMYVNTWSSHLYVKDWSGLTLKPTEQFWMNWNASCLMSLILTEWAKIPTDMFQNLVENRCRRVELLINGEMNSGMWGTALFIYNS